jgi:hypothetical protein
MPLFGRRRSRKPSGSSSLGIAALGDTEPEKLYFAWVEQFYDRGQRIMERRSAAVTSAWTASLVLGAAVPLSTSLGGPTWIPSVLGFSIVVVQGVQKFYAQHLRVTTELDALLRSMAQEARTLKAEQSPYANHDDRLANFHKKIESLMTRYNKESNSLVRTSYQASLATSEES